MARVFTQGEGKRLGLPGRNSIELLSAEKGTHSVTLRMVEIPVAGAGTPARVPHAHSNFEECIFVLSGHGVTHADSGEFPLEAGDTIWIPAREKHYTRNSGDVPLRLLCFFPVGEVSSATSESAPSSGPAAAV
jgi:mannose-6-phosphate isomerase-like protein (cupin superfamily)